MSGGVGVIAGPSGVNGPPRGLTTQGAGGVGVVRRRKGFAYFDPLLVDGRPGVMYELRQELLDYEAELAAERGRTIKLEGNYKKILKMKAKKGVAAAVAKGLGKISPPILWVGKRYGFTYFDYRLIELGFGILEELELEFKLYQEELGQEKRKGIMFERMIRKELSPGEGGDEDGIGDNLAADQEGQGSGLDINTGDVNPGENWFWWKRGENVVPPGSWMAPTGQQPVRGFGLIARGSLGGPAVQSSSPVILPLPSSPVVLEPQSASLSAADVKRNGVAVGGGGKKAVSPGSGMAPTGQQPVKVVDVIAKGSLGGGGRPGDQSNPSLILPLTSSPVELASKSPSLSSADVKRANKALSPGSDRAPTGQKPVTVANVVAKASLGGGGRPGDQSNPKVILPLELESKSPSLSTPDVKRANKAKEKSKIRKPAKILRTPKPKPVTPTSEIGETAGTGPKPKPVTPASGIGETAGTGPKPKPVTPASGNGETAGTGQKLQDETELEEGEIID